MANISRKMQIIKGLGITNTSAMGKLRFFDRYAESESSADISTPEEEKIIFEGALERAREQLLKLYKQTEENIGKKEAEIFEIHRMLLEDEEYIETVEGFISEGQSAGSAVMSTARSFEAMFADLNDDYLSARAADIKDISRRIFRLISGTEESTADFDEPFILLADDLSPSETIQLDRSKLLGFVTFEGSQNSHTAILARALGIPAIIGTGAISNELDGKNAIIDSFRGELIVDPDLAALDRYTDEVKKRAEEEKRLQTLVGRPTRTKGGKQIKLYANIGSPKEAELAYANDAEGIGLLRSEFLYIGANDFPDEDIQYRAYSAIVEKMHGRPVIIRTLDIGADKQAEYFLLPKEENPALGFRAIRYCLENRDVFKTQLRAICRASAKGKVAVMLPMIVAAREIKRAKEILIEVKNELRYECIDFDENIELGIMIETPAAAIMSDELAKYADFFSIGTNDLTQYVLAADRQNPRLAKMCRENTESLMRLVSLTVANAHRAGIWVGVCGELASEEEFVEKFINIGVDELSVAPSLVLRVREKIIESQ